MSYASDQDVFLARQGRNRIRNNLPQRRKDAKEKKPNIPNFATWRLGGRNSESERLISAKVAQAAKLTR
jgi:hypothetical protein